LFSLDEPDKYLVLLVRQPPLGTQRAGEALRMALGQSVSNRVTVILVDGAVWLAGPLKPELVGGGEITKWLAKLLDVEQQVWVESESMERYNMPSGLIMEGVEVRTREQIDHELLVADAVVVA